MVTTVSRAEKKQQRLTPPVDRPATGPGSIPPAPQLATPKRRPRRLLIAAGVVIVVVCGLATYWLLQRSADRVEVIGVAGDVAVGEQIQASDLVRVQIVADPALSPMSWSEASLVVGEYAAVDLRSGTLLTANSVTTARVPPPGKALVGVSVKAGQMPSSALGAGDKVQLVTVAATADSSTKVPAPVNATVYRIGGAASGGFYPVDVIVAQGDAARVASDAAAGRIVIVLLPRG